MRVGEAENSGREARFAVRAGSPAENKGGLTRSGRSHAEAGGITERFPAVHDLPAQLKVKLPSDQFPNSSFPRELIVDFTSQCEKPGCMNFQHTGHLLDKNTATKGGSSVFERSNRYYQTGGARQAGPRGPRRSQTHTQVFLLEAPGLGSIAPRSRTARYLTTGVARYYS